jgi:hypothetical protein
MLAITSRDGFFGATTQNLFNALLGLAARQEDTTATPFTF